MTQLTRPAAACFAPANYSPPATPAAPRAGVLPACADSRCREAGGREAPPFTSAVGAHQPPLCPCERRGLCCSSQDKTFHGRRLPDPNTPHIWGAQAARTLHPWSPFGVTGLPVQPCNSCTATKQGTWQPTDSCCHPAPTHSLVHTVASMCLHPGGFERGIPPPGHPPALGAQQNGAVGWPQCRQHGQRDSKSAPVQGDKAKAKAPPRLPGHFPGSAKSNPGACQPVPTAWS